MRKSTFCIFILSVSLCFHGSVLGETLPKGAYRESCRVCLFSEPFTTKDNLACFCLTDNGLLGGKAKDSLDKMDLIFNLSSTGEEREKYDKFFDDAHQYIKDGMLSHTDILTTGCVAIKNVDGSLECE
ncbi:MAG: hypothetical protein KZQ84_16470 [Candidatus Thiodiazotropha sp. (ex Lucinoma borealis)]|nr:hypothetical protein [Candidatus Thiodiazotropha sp. (ex Lucinoma borealis)]